ncbi:MAG TPA: DUF2254 domain-containing protein [Thermomicrobiales bacterium]|nr:DUF2254 domain-containing protein [Thermomicrobiales bacterium]
MPAAIVRWKGLQDQLWFIPSILTVAAVLLAFVMVWVDRTLIGQRRPETDWLFGAGASGAREVLSAISSTMITVTGLVFSITVVALQLASSQYTPRVLRTFTGDRGNQLVLGVFIATFTYSLLVLRTVREGNDDGIAPFVPSASVTVALLLAGASVGFLIYFISHAANAMRASVIIDRAARDTLAVVRRLYPDRDDDAADPGKRPRAETPPIPATGVVDIRATRSGYLQEISDDGLLAALSPDDLSLELSVTVGSHVLAGTVIGQAWPTERIDLDGLQDQVTDALILGHERTMHADVDFGLRQLSDIAVRALSPGINDPTTATQCIDRLAEILGLIAVRPEPVAVRRDQESRGTLIRRPLSWEELLRTAFDEIRHYGSDDPMVARHLSRTLRLLIDIVPTDRVQPLLDLRGAVVAMSDREIEDPGDVARIETAY